MASYVALMMPAALCFVAWFITLESRRAARKCLDVLTANTRNFLCLLALATGTIVANLRAAVIAASEHFTANAVARDHWVRLIASVSVSYAAAGALGAVEPRTGRAGPGMAE